MPYPTSLPSNKHDLVGPPPPPPHDSSSHHLLPSTESIIDALTARQAHPPADPGSLHRIATVYTYPDAPTEPKPLSRTLEIIGYVETSLGLVRKFATDDGDARIMSKCALGVKLADDARHRSRLKPRDIENSDGMARFAAALRGGDLAGVVACDLMGRFGIVRAMTADGDDGGEGGGGEHTSADFAVELYVGNLEEIRGLLLTNGGGRAAAPAEATADDQREEKGGEGGLWQPPGTDDAKDDAGGGGEGLWQPPGADEDDDGGGGAAAMDDGFGGGGSSWEPAAPSGFDLVVQQSAGQKRPRSPPPDDGGGGGDMLQSSFHADAGAATADAFYSGLVRSLDTRADSRLFHMRAFNGWVKATQIAELDPRTGSGSGSGKQKQQQQQPLRVLDLACGKGGDLGKWTIHPRGVRNYVGVDVARGSLKDAAIRARKMRKQLRNRCTFTCADLGADVPGRPRSSGARLQKLLSWSLAAEPDLGRDAADPVFEPVAGGGIAPQDRFDVVSIQFAIHYMMSSRRRAMRFFQTVSELLDVGGNLIATTIDSRVAVYHLMNLGLDLHFDDDDGNGSSSGEGGGDDAKKAESATVTVGGGACRIKFDGDTVRKIFKPRSSGGGGGADHESREYMDDDLFGLQYTFTLIEGEDHSAGVGEAVDLPEWLSPLPALTSLAREAGFELEYSTNFHEFYKERRDPRLHPTAHNALYNMHVLDRDGSISDDEWDISRLYVAIKFRKVRESRLVLDEEEDNREEDDDVAKEEEANATAGAARNQEAASEEASGSDAAATAALSNPKAKELLPIAMVKAKKVAGEEVWKSLSPEEKKQRTNNELKKMLS